ncbi:hypothetical protein RE628_11505 [Paenibacillus sp. D2_2]|uniref:hypothetical protein n=1 Tax=Paenibacillus sp. D2_2 TaxID=3073092 RepID=UPI002815B70B|nr:hypothetical protein [Paenibacillus sp. D2_2]WMT42851.1 hypothetical protein RE628_11505 [Paenibacillus sp. D2_2]
MKLALRVELSISEYNEITPHELNLHIQAYNERMTYENKERLTAAYLTAGLARAKKMPDLKKILGEDKPDMQTDEKMLQVVKQLNAAMGGTVRSSDE